MSFFSFFAFTHHALPVFINRDCPVCIGFRCEWCCCHSTIWFWRESEKCPWVRALRFFSLFMCLKQVGWKISSANSAAGLQLVTISQDTGMLFKLGKYESKRLNPELRNFQWNSLMSPKGNSESLKWQNFDCIKDRTSFQIRIFSDPFEMQIVSHPAP